MTDIHNTGSTETETETVTFTKTSIDFVSIEIKKPEPEFISPEDFDRWLLAPLVEISGKKCDREQLLPTFRGILKCQYVDVVNLTLAGQPVTVWVDDEGLMRNTDSGTVLGFLVIDDEGREYALAGNLILTGGVSQDGESLGSNFSQLDMKTFEKQGNFRLIELETI